MSLLLILKCYQNKIDECIAMVTLMACYVPMKANISFPLLLLGFIINNTNLERWYCLALVQSLHLYVTADCRISSANTYYEPALGNRIL